MKTQSDGGKSGALLVSLIVTMTILGVVGAAVVSMTTATLQNRILGNDAHRAYYIAESGIVYARSFTNPPSGTFQLAGAEGYFTLTNYPTGRAGRRLLQSRGVVNNTARYVFYDYGVIADASSPESGPMQGDGSPDNPWQVATPENLQDIGSGTGHDDGSDNDYSLSDHYQLVADIDMDPTYNFSPIGGFWGSFTGVLDGNYHVVRNLYIYRPTEDDVGLMSVLRWGSDIRNLGIENADVTGYTDVGILSGRNGANCENIIGCYSTGIVKGKANVGGLIGHVAWDINGSIHTTIENCYSTADVMFVNLHSGIVWDFGSLGFGGLIGKVGSLNLTSIIRNCYASGAVDISGSNLLSSWQRNRYSEGGLLGYHTLPYAPETYDSYYDCTVYGDCTVPEQHHGTPQTTGEMLLPDTYQNWDFTNVWHTPVDSPPTLRGFDSGGRVYDRGYQF
jgi:hypothetical protein